MYVHGVYMVCMDHLCNWKDVDKNNFKKNMMTKTQLMFSSLVLPEFNRFCFIFKYGRESPATFDLPALQIFFLFWNC